MSATDPPTARDRRRDPGAESGDGSGGGWVVRTVLAATGLLVAVGMAWYVAEGYRRAGGPAGDPGGSGARAPAGAADSAPRGSGQAARTRRQSERSRWLEIRAPVVTFPTLSGDTASLAAYRGQTVVLNFWATWCPPCVREIPELARLQDSLRPGSATVVGIAVSSGSREKIRAFGEEHGINYPVWLSDPGTAATEYRAVGLPMTLLVDRHGVIRRRYMGPQTFETLRSDLRALADSAPDAPDAASATAGTGER